MRFRRPAIQAERVSAPACATDAGDVLTFGPTTITYTGVGGWISDAKGIGTSTASVRAERTAVKATPGDGRVYQINFSASDGKAAGTCTGKILVGVPHDQGQRSLPNDSGVRYNSITGVLVPPGTLY